MKREASVFEYETIIIPLHEEELQRDLIRAQKYIPGSGKREALILSARLKEIHIQYLRLHIIELKGAPEKVQEAIMKNKKIENEVREELERLSLDVRDL